MAHLRTTPLSCSSFLFLLSFFLKKCSFSFFSLFLLSNMFDCWHPFQSLIVGVSSVGGARSMEMWCPDDIGRDSLDWVATNMGECTIQLTRMGWRLLAC